jgi:hypothetical protein
MVFMYEEPPPTIDSAANAAGAMFSALKTIRVEAPVARIFFIFFSYLRKSDDL